MVKKYTCNICGYPDLDEAPWGENGKIPSHNICECCGVEFGYEDCTEETIRRYRQKWIDAGGEWFCKELRPANWNMKEQLRNIGIFI